MGKPERHLIECACHSTDHAMIVTIYDNDPEWPEAYIDFQMTSYYPWWKRLAVSIRYVLTGRTISGHWDEVVLEPEQRRFVADLLDPGRMSTKDPEPFSD